MDRKKLTWEQAFKAMFYFLRHEYDMTKSDDIGGILGSLDWTIWDAPGPADPAAWADWLAAVEKVFLENPEVDIRWRDVEPTPKGLESSSDPKLHVVKDEDDLS